MNQEQIQLKQKIKFFRLTKMVNLHGRPLNGYLADHAQTSGMVTCGKRGQKTVVRLD